MFHPTATGVENTEDKVAVWLSFLAQHILVITLGLSPLLFIPTAWAPVNYTKLLIILTGVLIALIFQSLAVLREGKLTLRAPLPVIAMLGLVVVMAVSAVLSGDMRDALIGNAFGVQTVSFVGLLALIIFSGLLLRSSKTAILRFYMLLVASSLVLGLFHILRFIFGPDALSLGFFSSSVSSPLGGWNDLALFFGAILLMALVAIEQLPLTKMARIILTVVTAVSLVVLAAVNFVFVWIVLGIVSLVVLMYGLTKHRFTNNQPSLEGVQASSVVSIVLSVIVFACSAMFVVGGATFGTAISNWTGVNYLEVRPSMSATFDIARQVMHTNPVLGIGPNKFVDAWRLYKDPNINQTIFWNTNFESGNGYLTTFLVTTGVLGFVAWILFLLTLLWGGIKIMSRLSHQDNFWRFVAVSSFVSAIYLWGMTIVYVPSGSMLILAASCTGIFLAAYTSIVPTRSLTLSVMNNRSVGLVLVATAILTIFGAVGSLYFVSGHYLALHNFNRSINTIKDGDSIDQVLAAIAESYQLSANDNFARQVAGYNLAQIESLLTAEATSETAQVFQTAAASGVNAAQLAINNDRSEPLNWLVLGRIYSDLIVAGVDGAYDRAKDAYTQAATLDPQNPLPVLLEAQAASRNQDNDAARQFAEQAINMKPNYVDALLFLTQLDVVEGRVDDAIKRTQALTTLEPSNAARQYQLGILQSSKGDLQASAAAFERAVQLDPNFANARYFLALDYSEMDRPTDAKAQLEKVLQLNPGNELVMSLIKQLDETGKIKITQTPASAPVSDDEVSVGEGGQVSASEAPDTPLVSTVNNTADEGAMSENTTATGGSQ